MYSLKNDLDTTILQSFMLAGIFQPALVVIPFLLVEHEPCTVGHTYDKAIVFSFHTLDTAQR